MKIGYARVSTRNQNLDRQIKELKQNGCEEIFQEKASGKNIEERLQFQRLLAFARKQDSVVVQSLDRLGRDYDEIKQVITLFNEKGIELIVLDAPFLKFNTGNKTLDKALFDMLASLLSYIAENERKKILERQAQGIALAKEKGIYKGKPLEYSLNAKNLKKRLIYNGIVADLQNNLPILQIAKKYNVTRKLIYRIKKDLESSIIV